ncbi:double zinc ribbon domain-containing protein [Paracoccaceae bacterium GXU_MW_L88]
MSLDLFTPATNGMKARAILKKSLHLLFPPRCVACNEELHNDSALCPGCWGSLEMIDDPACPQCSLPQLGAGTSDIPCDACLAEPKIWDSARAVAIYKGSLRTAILAMKHGDRPDLARQMAPWMARAGRDLIARADLIAPVPLHWRRMAKRRYNQSALLAKHLSSQTRTMPDLLRKIQHTGSQEGRSRAERLAALENVFSVSAVHRERVKGRSILLVDDVLTTGATLASCTQALRMCGAREVNVLVLARVAYHTQRA